VRRGWLLTIAVIAGCYGDPQRAFLAPSIDAALVDSAPVPDAPDAPPEPDARICTTLATSPDAVNLVNESGAAPTAMGGALVDGTYRLESLHGYGGPVTSSYKSTWKFTGNQWELALRQAGATDDQLQSGTMVVNTSGLITMTPTCGGGNAGGFSYTFNTSDGTLDYFVGGGGTTGMYHHIPVP